MKYNLHQIQLAIESYKTERGSFPAITADTSFVKFCEARKIEMPPVNPFTGQPMRCVPFRDLPCPGEYTYVYLPVEIYRGERIAYDTYYLIAYGDRNTKGMDVDEDGTADFVILQLSSGTEIRWAVYADPAEVSDPSNYRWPPVSLSEALRLMFAGNLPSTEPDA